MNARQIGADQKPGLGFVPGQPMANGPHEALFNTSPMYWLFGFTSTAVSLNCPPLQCSVLSCRPAFTGRLSLALEPPWIRPTPLYLVHPSPTPLHHRACHRSRRTQAQWHQTDSPGALLPNSRCDLDGKDYLPLEYAILGVWLRPASFYETRG